MPVKNRKLTLLKRGMRLPSLFLGDKWSYSKWMRSPFRDRKYLYATESHMVLIVNKQHIPPIDWAGTNTERVKASYVRGNIDHTGTFVPLSRETFDKINNYPWSKEPIEHLDERLFIGSLKIDPNLFANIKHIFIELDKTFGRDTYTLEISENAPAQFIIVRTRNKDIDVQFMLMAVMTDLPKSARDMHYDLEKNQIIDPIIFDDEK